MKTSSSCRDDDDTNDKDNSVNEDDIVGVNSSVD